MSLSHDDQRRYARHLLMPELGEQGQERLLRSRVLVIGAGGLGASALSYLAACGVGHIGVVDDDVVELSNLNRQIIHETGDIGRLKVESAADRLSELNPSVDITTHPIRFSSEHADLMQGYDLVIDGTDNFETRYVINDTGLRYGIPWVYCAVRGWEGQLSCFIPSDINAPCYRCLVPAAPPGRNDCAERGVLGALVGVMGSLIAVEAIKLLTGVGKTYAGRLLRYHALTGQWKESRLRRDPDCRSCSSFS